MNCSIIRDLIPLYIDGCCSEESRQTVKSHLENCSQCKKLYDDMNAPEELVAVSKTPEKFRKLSDWKASIMQSVLLFISFGMITAGVALEAASPSGLLNGFWAFNIVIPATGLLLSLANWYFVRVYKSRKIFSACSLFITIGLTLCGYIWANHHYERNLFGLVAGENLAGIFHIIRFELYFNWMGICLTAIFCTLSKILSNQYAKMLGKE